MIKILRKSRGGPYSSGGEGSMNSDHLRNVPFGHGPWGVVVASVIAIVLVLAYVEGPRSVVRGAFAVTALALLGQQLANLRRRSDHTRRWPRGARRG